MRTAASFPLAEASGYGLFTNFFIVALICEAVPMHLLLSRWSHVVAWISSAAAGYGVVWMIRLRRSIDLQPIQIDDYRVVLQVGFLCRLEFPREHIVSCRRINAGSAPHRKESGYLALVVINEPQWLIELAEPTIAHGLYGRQKSVTRIGVAVDDADGFGSFLATS